MDGFDLSELDQFTKDLIKTANEVMPRESKNFIKKEAGKLNKVNKDIFKSKNIGEDTGNLKDSFKAGKAYKFDGNWSARAYNSSPHAHLLDKGWMHKSRNGTEKWVVGYNFMGDAAEQFEDTFTDDCDKFVDVLLDKGLFKK